MSNVKYNSTQLNSFTSNPRDIVDNYIDVILLFRANMVQYCTDVIINNASFKIKEVSEIKQYVDAAGRYQDRIMKDLFSMPIKLHSKDKWKNLARLLSPQELSLYFETISFINSKEIGVKIVVRRYINHDFDTSFSNDILLDERIGYSCFYDLNTFLQVRDSLKTKILEYLTAQKYKKDLD